LVVARSSSSKEDRCAADDDGVAGGDGGVDAAGLRTNASGFTGLVRDPPAHNPEHYARD